MEARKNRERRRRKEGEEPTKENGSNKVTHTDESLFYVQRKGEGYFSPFTLIAECPNKNVGWPKQHPNLIFFYKRPTVNKGELLGAPKSFAGTPSITVKCQFCPFVCPHIAIRMGLQIGNPYEVHRIFFIFQKYNFGINLKLMVQAGIKLVTFKLLA